MHLEDWPHVGAFNYRMKGFSNQTCHHYYKHYQMALWDKIKKKISGFRSFDDLCIGARKRHAIQLDLMLKFKREYNGLFNSIAIMHYVENSHDRIERLDWVDNDLYKFLSTGFNEGLFNNTAIFLFSDHGSRFTDKRLAKNRYLEERLPFISVYLPQHYREIYPDKYNNLKINSNRLTSPFDIHATVRDLTDLPPISPNSFHLANRSISLLARMPERNCEQIGISDHFCTCIQDWTSSSIYRNDVIEAVLFTINSINRITNSTKKLCSRLTLKQVISADTIKKDKKIIYKVQFITMPNNGVYETILVNDFEKKYEFTSASFSIFSRNDISRIDSYGEQPKCISDFSKNPAELLDIRKFCHCNFNVWTHVSKIIGSFF